MNLKFNLETIYEDADFQINDNDKVGIVGVNGAGKTTFFNVLLNNISLDSGHIIIDKKLRIGYLPQVISLDDKKLTVLDYLMQARPIDKLRDELTDLYNKVAITTDTKEQERVLKRIGNVQELLEYYDVYNAENILMDIISNMQIDMGLLDMQLSKLSGGQKSKIAFVHLLYSKPEILLLDEPTNHLDNETREYITNYLEHYKGTVLIISHDVAFLDRIVNKILYINKATHKIVVYTGNYSDYQKKLANDQKNKELLIERQEKEVAKIRDFVLQYSNSSGKRKRIAQSREKMLTKKMSQMEVRDKTLKRVKIKLKPHQEGSKIPLKVNNLSFGYKEKLIDNLSFIINSKERFLIVGENGIGKSTLLKLLINQLQPWSGTINYGSKTEFAYYAQEQEALDLDKTVLENVDSEEYSDKELRTILGSFLFFDDDVFKKANVLSPGERARISLCKVILKKANLLLLDEPTNHLDPETQKIIGENFRDYEGTIILVSHNSSFVRSIGIDRMLILPSGRITNYSDELLLHYEQLNSK